MKKVLVIWLLLLFAVNGNAASDENLNSLNARGNTALANGDYITAAYYFERIRNSSEWDSFGDRIGVLSKLAMLEERQARSARAAIWYGQILDIYKETRTEGEANPAIDATFRYYAIRYADTLERSGSYPQANRLLWSLYDESDPASRIMILERLIRTYSFLSPSLDDIKSIQSKIGPDQILALGWPLARLYFTHNHLVDSFELIETLWPNSPMEARNHLDFMLDVYRERGEIDHLFERIREYREAEPGFDPYLLLETEALRRLGRGEEALAVLESDFARRANVVDFDSIIQIIGRVPTQVMDEYIDLTQRIHGDDAAMDMLRQLVRHQPMDIQRRERLGAMLSRVGENEEAIELWLEWVKTQNNQPSAMMMAAERIHALGDSLRAIELLQVVGDELSPDMLLQRGLLGLRMNDFEMAFASLREAGRSAQIGDMMVSSEIVEYAQTAANVDALFSAFIEEVSGVSFAQTPQWASNLLQEIGFRPQFLPKFEELLAAEPTGAWRIQAAREAVNQGMSAWALNQIRKTPDESPYRQAADMEIALILSERPTIPAQREAANLLAKALDPILSATEEIFITPGLIPRLLDYADMQINGYQPAEALRVIRLIETAMASYEEPLGEDLFQRLEIGRAHV